MFSISFFKTSKQTFEYLKRSPEGIREQSLDHKNRNRKRMKGKWSVVSLPLHLSGGSFGLRSRSVMGWSVGMTLEEVGAGNERSDRAGQAKSSKASIRRIANHSKPYLRFPFKLNPRLQTICSHSNAYHTLLKWGSHASCSFVFDSFHSNSSIICCFSSEIYG